MADTAQTPEAVAWNLCHAIVSKERGSIEMDREYILGTYSECLRAAKGNYRTEKEKTAAANQQARITRM